MIINKDIICAYNKYHTSTPNMKERLYTALHLRYEYVQKYGTEKFEIPHEYHPNVVNFVGVTYNVYGVPNVFMFDDVNNALEKQENDNIKKQINEYKKLSGILKEYDQEIISPKGNVKINNKTGIGAIPINQDIGYKSYIYKMTPKQFLSLVPTGKFIDDDIENKEKFDYQKQIEEQGIALPVLFVDVSDFDCVLKVTGHEGRHRVQTLMNKFGVNSLIPVVLYGGDNILPPSLNGWEIEAQNSDFRFNLDESRQERFENYKFKEKEFNSKGSFREFSSKLPELIKKYARRSSDMQRFLLNTWRNEELDVDELTNVFQDMEIDPIDVDKICSYLMDKFPITNKEFDVSNDELIDF